MASLSGETPTASGAAETDGWLCFSGDRKSVVRFRLDCCAYYWLRPYEGWERLARETRPHRDAFVATGRVELVTRVAIRYISRFTVPDDCEVGRCLPMAPRAPEPMHQAPHAFESRILTVHDGATVQVTEALSAGPPRQIGVDIEAANEESIEPDDTEVWSRLRGLLRINDEGLFAHASDDSRRNTRGGPLVPGRNENGGSP